MSKRIVKTVPGVESATETAPRDGMAEGGFAPPAGDEAELPVNVAGDDNAGAQEAPRSIAPPVDLATGEQLAPAEATAPRAQDEAGRPMDQWGLPLNGPARARALAELDRRDPHTHPEDWPDQGAAEE
ncbi:hypothetical protein HY78_00485 [Rhizorhabdus wittichii DC-6]|nr:hypothetical protein HY78_00485 [Rhizorhabdus wittichii DC-6]